MATSLKIQISSSDKEYILDLMGNEFIFGRSPKSDVPIDDPCLSRSHFSIYFTEQGAWLKDLGSSNGTLLNGIQVSLNSGSRLNESDIITIVTSQTIIKILSIGSDEVYEVEHGEDLVNLSDKIIQAANEQVDFILTQANKRAEEIIESAKELARKDHALAVEKFSSELLEKQLNAETELEVQIEEKRESFNLEFSLMEAQKKQELNHYIMIEKENFDTATIKAKKLFDDEYNEKWTKLKFEIEKKTIDFEIEEKEFKTRFADERKTLEVQIKTRSEELENLNKIFEKKSKDLLEKMEKDLAEKVNEQTHTINEINENIKNKKNESMILEKDLESQKILLVQRLEAHHESKKIELQEQIDTYLSKIESSRNEFTTLLDKYEVKKIDQQNAVDQLMAKKEQLNLELSELNTTFDEKNNELSKMSQDILRNIDQKQEVELQLNSANEKLQSILVDCKNNDALLVEKENKLITLKLQLEEQSKNVGSVSSQIDQSKEILADLKKKIDATARANSEIVAEHIKEIEKLKADFLQKKSELAEEMRKKKEDEEKRLHEMARHEIAQINKIKEDALRLVLDLEDSISKEMSVATSKVFASSIGIEKFRENAPAFDKNVRAALQNGVLKLLKDEMAPLDLNKSKKTTTVKKTWQPFVVGMSLSAMLFGLLPYLFRNFQEQNDPVRLQREAQEREAAAPPAKKFTPEKTTGIGSTFVKSVIYTSDYYETFALENFRSELMKEGSVYLYKQWKIEEEKSIEGFAMIFSLIDALHAKAEKIDPDYEKRDIDKMIALEKETTKKLEKIFGNEVRLEAAVKFQNRFYQDFISKRGIASGVKE